MILFQISFMYYNMIGAVIVVVVGTIASYVFGSVDLKSVNPDHITPMMKRYDIYDIRLHTIGPGPITIDDGYAYVYIDLE